MAHIPQNDFSEKNDSTDENVIKISAGDQNTLDVPHDSFISDSEMSRDGQDLVLESPNGETLIVEDYFTADPAPLLESPSGATLNGDLIDSFLHSAPQYAANASMSDESPVGAVEEMSGEATVIRADGTSEPITLGTPIYQGDVIETSDNGAVNISFIDETSMAVSQNARLAVDEYQFDPATESGVTNFSVLRGVFVFTSGLIGRDDPDDVQIDTPVGSIGIRGTIIAGHINPGGESEITVVEGAIVVRNGAMERTLSQQFESLRLGGFNDDMQELGVQSAMEIRGTYGSVGHVVPQLFSSINDAVQEERGAAEEAVREEAAQEETATEERDAAEESAQEDAEGEPQQEPQPQEIQEGEMPPPAFDGHSASEGGIPQGERSHGRSHRGRHHRGRRGRFNHERDDNESTYNNGDSVNNSDNQNQESTSPISTSGSNGVTAGIALNDHITGDFDGDNDSDIAFIRPNGDIRIQESPGGATLSTHSGNYDSIAAIGDINNDGVTDFIGGDKNSLSQDGSITLVNNGTGTGTTINNPTPGIMNHDHFGHSVAGIGDFDGDGRSDFVVGAPDNLNFNGGLSINNKAGSAFLYTDHSNHSNYTQILGTGSNSQDFGSYVHGVGDINGDGFSDIIIGSAAGQHEAHIVFGHNGSTDMANNDLSTHGFAINTGGQDIVAAGAAGDINGDGYDDFAVSLDDGTGINTYVVYGNGASTDIDLSYLDNPDNALKIHHAGASGEDYQVTAIGDNDGDGFDDIQVGIEGGAQYVVHGDIGGDSVPYVRDGTASDGNTNADEVSATVNGQSLVGDVAFFDNGHTGLSMRGGGSDNEFHITKLIANSADTFRNIDGGNGHDTIVADANLDFKDINFEQISQIEHLEIMGTSTTVTLTAENIFNLLKSSDDGTLHITGSGTGSALEIDDLNGATGADIHEKIVNTLNEDGNGADYKGIVDGYDHYEIGGYHLYIDDPANLTVNVV